MAKLADQTACLEPSIFALFFHACPFSSCIYTIFESKFERSGKASALEEKTKVEEELKEVL